MSTPLGFARYGDKQNSEFFEQYLLRLLEERDRVGLSELIQPIDALMITVDPGQSVRYIGELCLMTPYHYLVTLESESHYTHTERRTSMTGFCFCKIGIHTIHGNNLGSAIEADVQYRHRQIGRTADLHNRRLPRSGRAQGCVR